MDVDSLHVEHPHAQNLVQRSALFDVCLTSRLTHLMVAYIRTEESRTQSKGAFAGVKNYVLKEPTAVQRCLETIEQNVIEIENEQQFNDRESPRTSKTDDVEEELRHLNGLRMILIALTEILKEGPRQNAYSFHNLPGCRGQRWE